MSKISITTEISWSTMVDAIGELANKIETDNPKEFALLDAQRLEVIARNIRFSLQREYNKKHLLDTYELDIPK